MQLIKSQTFENLKKCYIAECAARTRYEFVEYGQRNEGYTALATITDKIAYQEFNHARMLYTKIQSADTNTIISSASEITLPYRQKWDLAENLRLTAEDEGDEARFYLTAAKTADKEGFDDVAALFEMIRQVELKHRKIFLYLHDLMTSGQLYERQSKQKWLCPGCGYETTDTKAPDTCPLCMAKMQTFSIPLPKELSLC